MAKPALGRGLGALLGGAVTAVKNAATPAELKTDIVASPPVPAASTAPVETGVRKVPLDRIHPSPLQPRKDFTPEALRELADSIREQGIVQPLLVREKDGHFELIAGERRWRAAQMAGLAEAPVIVRQADDLETLELALVENLQRENLNPIEEALGFRQLIDQFKLTQEQAAVKVGKSRVAVANALRLLNLPSSVQSDMRDGKLSTGHAKVILALSAPELQLDASVRVQKEGLTVRQTEDLVSLWASNKTATVPPVGVVRVPPVQAPSRDIHVVAMENKLRERLGTKVGLRYRQGKGSIEIRYYSDDELDRILQIMGVDAG